MFIKSNMLLDIFSILFLKTVSSGWPGWKDNRNINYTLYEVTAFNTRERSVLYFIHTSNDAIIFLNSVTNDAASPMYVIVNDCCTENFEAILQNNHIEYVQIYKDSVLKEFAVLDDVKKYDNDEVPTLNEQFLDWSGITKWVQSEVKKFSTLEKINLGETYERRELFILKISNGSKKPAVFIMGGEQGRDRMSPAVILNFINNVLTSRNKVLVDFYDLYFMPVFNPDGYEYSMKTERFWNKNRKHFYPEKICPQNEDEVAVGVNIDRNWFFTNSGYIQGAECDSIYIGHDTITEEEPLAVATFLNSIATNLMAFINVRGFAKLLTVPYAHLYEVTNNYAVLREILLHASDKAFIRYNVSYDICCTQNCIYNITGNAPDWVKKNMNVPIVFTLYIKHDNSFLPQIEQIPTLLCHFTVIVKETLLLAYNIYGPLFNCASQLFTIFVTFVALISLLFLNKCLL